MSLSKSSIDFQIEYFAAQVNALLKGDPDVSPLPLDPKQPQQLFNLTSKGLLLYKLINKVEPNTILPKNIKLHPKNTYETIENHNAAICGAVKLGAVVVNIDAMNLLEGKTHAVLGLLWQILRYYLVKDVQKNPEVLKLLKQGEDVNSFVSLTPEQTLIRWVNFHLENQHKPPIKNLSSDLKGGHNYLYLLHEIDPKSFDLDTLLKENDLNKIGQEILNAASKLGVDASLFSPASVVEGDEKLNLALIAKIFNAKPGIVKQVEDHAAKEALQKEKEQHELTVKLFKEKEEERRLAALKQEEEERKALEAHHDLLQKQIKEYEEKKALLEEKERLLKEREEAIKQHLGDKEKELDAEIKKKEAELAKNYEHEFLRKVSQLEIEMKQHQEEELKKKQQEKEKEKANLVNLVISKLYVKIQRAKCLKNFESLGISDPYVRLSHVDERGKELSTYKTKVVFNNLDPVWNETAEIKNFHPNHRLILEVFDYDFKIHSDDLMGKVEIPRSEIAHGAEKWYVLTNKESKSDVIVQAKGWLASIRSYTTQAPSEVGVTPYGAIRIGMDVLYEKH